MNQEQYRRAISVNSTAPYYVLVTIIDDTTGESFVSCLEAQYLKGAISLEFSEDANPEERALSNTERVFHFSNPAAFDAVRPRYTADELEEARKAIRFIGLKSLSNLSSPERNSLGKLTRSAALAHAIIEQGAPARRGCRAGIVYAELDIH